jgi:DNA uptake protein ComE-like DNA-binding protein
MSRGTHRARPGRSGRTGGFRLAALVVAASACAGSPAIAQPGDVEAITRAAVLHSDPADIQAVATVCGRCHAAAMYLAVPRSYLRWEEVFARMSRQGASGSDEQLNAVIRYFDRNLTIVNVNTSPVEELGPVLQISDEAADQIARLRAARPLRDIGDLETVDGIDLGRMKTMKSRGLLQF